MNDQFHSPNFFPDISSLFPGPRLPKSDDSNYHITYHMPNEVLLVTAVPGHYAALYINGKWMWKGGTKWHQTVGIMLRKLIESGVVTGGERLMDAAHLKTGLIFPATLEGITLETP